MDEFLVKLKALELYLVAGGEMADRLYAGLPEGRTADVVEQVDLHLRKCRDLLHREHDALSRPGYRES
jgi:hypothetical protein